MTPLLSPESLAQIRAIIHEVVDRRFDAVDRQFVEVRQEIEESAAENRRHFGVLNENLTAKLELVVEGFVGQNQRMDQLESEVHAGFAQVDRQLMVIWSRLPKAEPGNGGPRRRKKR